MSAICKACKAKDKTIRELLQHSHNDRLDATQERLKRHHAEASLLAGEGWDAYREAIVGPPIDVAKEVEMWATIARNAEREMLRAKAEVERLATVEVERDELKSEVKRLAKFEDRVAYAQQKARRAESGGTAAKKKIAELEEKLSAAKKKANGLEIELDRAKRDIKNAKRRGFIGVPA